MNTEAIALKINCKFNFTMVTHLHKTSLKSHFLLLEYSKPF